MVKSQETQQLAVEMSGKWGFGGCRHILAYSLEDAQQLAAGFFTASRKEYSRGVRINLDTCAH